jgi:hypothetical protein
LNLNIDKKQFNIYKKSEIGEKYSPEKTPFTKTGTGYKYTGYETTKDGYRH